MKRNIALAVTFGFGTYILLTVIPDLPGLDEFRQAILSPGIFLAAFIWADGIHSGAAFLYLATYILIDVLLFSLVWYSVFRISRMGRLGK